MHNCPLFWNFMQIHKGNSIQKMFLIVTIFSIPFIYFNFLTVVVLFISLTVVVLLHASFIRPCGYNQTRLLFVRVCPGFKRFQWCYVLLINYLSQGFRYHKWRETVKNFFHGCKYLVYNYVYIERKLIYVHVNSFILWINLFLKFYQLHIVKISLNIILSVPTLLLF